MESFKKITSYAVIFLQTLIVFLLTFESRVEIPAWLQAFGRTHPLLLHLPIGLVLISTLLALVEDKFSGSIKEVTMLLLYLSSLTASLSAAMGLILSFEGGYNGWDIGWHKWTGVAVSFWAWLLIALPSSSKFLKPSMIVGVILTMVAGHFGSMLTHGDNFIFEPLMTDERKKNVITDETTFYEAAIYPILESKCQSCHNEQKSKGRLIMTNVEALLKGGKHGALWTPGHPDQSLMVERLLLPMDAKEHMPPKDKPQLTPSEIDLISLWIKSGPDLNTSYKDFANDSLKKMALPIIESYDDDGGKAASKYAFEFVAPEKITTLNSPYRTVFQVAANEPAIHADFFLAGSFKRDLVEELSAVKEQLVSMNLSGMPFSDEDVDLLQNFSNLEKLVLNNTKVEGTSLDQLVSLKNLKSVSLSGTAVDVHGLRKLAKNESIKEVFIWNTNVNTSDLDDLRKDFSNISWIEGYVADPNEKLKLSPPLLMRDGQVLKPNETVSFKHNLKGAVIRYTTDSKDPDSIQAPVFEKPIVISGYSIVKTKAYRDGWISSGITENVFFVDAFKPESAELVSHPDKKYQGDGASTLMDDEKGMPDFYRDPKWMGFREEPLEAYFFFDSKNQPAISSVTLSYARNVYAMCMPPFEMEVWGGVSKTDLKLLGKIKPTQPDSYVPVRIEGATISFSPQQYSCYKLVAKPLAKLPAFRDAKKDKGWLMVDEVYFY